jgi:hypothetical protein
MSSTPQTASARSKDEPAVRINPFIGSDGVPRRGVGPLASAMRGELGPTDLLGLSFRLATIITAVAVPVWMALSVLSWNTNAGMYALVLVPVAGAAIGAVLGKARFVSTAMSLYAVAAVVAGIFVAAERLPGRRETDALDLASSCLGVVLLVAGATVLIGLIRYVENRVSKGPRLLWAVEILVVAVTSLAAGWQLSELWAPLSFVVSALGLAVALGQAHTLVRSAGRVDVYPRVSSQPAAELPAAAPMDHDTGVEDLDENEPRAVSVPAGEPVAPEAPAAPVAPLLGPPEQLEDLMAELDRFIGMEQAKEGMRRLVKRAQSQIHRSSLGLRTPFSMGMHLVLAGPPGTGKTEFARLVARIYRSLGVLPIGHLVEVDRATLIADRLGATAIKVKDVVASALGGVLFIDEAYLLTPETNGGWGSDPFGQEAVGELLTAMENHRSDLVVIFAGYEGPMQRFVDSNEGLRSRIGSTISFGEYAPHELTAIATKFAAEADYEYSSEAMEYLRNALEALYEAREQGWGNAREVRNLSSTIFEAHGERTTGVRDLAVNRTLTADDVRDGLGLYLKDRATPSVSAPLADIAPALYA